MKTTNIFGVHSSNPQSMHRVTLT